MELSPVARRWSEILDEAAASGMDLCAFARARDLNRSTLGWWRWKLGRTDVKRRAPPTFLELSVEHPPEFPDRSPPSFPDDTLVVELRGGGARISVNGGTNLGLLRRVLDALC